MIIVPVLAVWAFYGVGSWGWVLLKGYNIPFSTWFNPVHPYTWPGGTPPMVPAGSILPTGKAGGPGTGGAPALGTIGAESARGAVDAGRILTK